MGETGELKPCTFCGGEAQVARTAAGYWAAYCEKPMCGRVGNFKTEAEAIEAWNTRAERTCHRVDVNGYGFRFECSACGYVAIVHNCEIRLDELPNYCPNCGAKVVRE